MSSERQYRRELALFGKMLHDRGYVAAMDGNLSVRLDEDRILATPTSMCKGMMRPSDMVVVDLDGHCLRGQPCVSKEIGMPLLIFRMPPHNQRRVARAPVSPTGFAA